MYKFGDYVVNNTTGEVGRVVRMTDNKEGYFVCYHGGCTAANTPLYLLRKATTKERLSAPGNIGYHRFDSDCPDYHAEYCACTCAERMGK